MSRTRLSSRRQGERSCVVSVRFSVTMLAVCPSFVLCSRLGERASERSLREARHLRELYGVVCEKWKKLHAKLNGVLAVGACGVGRKFDLIDDDTSVAMFLTFADPDTNDTLCKVW